MKRKNDVCDYFFQGLIFFCLTAVTYYNLNLISFHVTACW